MKNFFIEIEKLNWNKVAGLMPAIIQDDQSAEVLMLGYMNQEALMQTCQTGKVTFYSRTKKRLWTKGESSGHELILVHIAPDCDADTLLIQVKPTGPCCHLNKPSCFEKAHKFRAPAILNKLRNTIEQRYHERPQDSYITKLFQEGIYRIAQKIGEEGVELALASVSGSKENIIYESADVLFHILILLKQCNIEFDDILLELERREK